MIKFITSILSLLWVLLVGTPNQPKNSLYRQPPKKDFKIEISNWALMNYNYIALAAMIFLLIIFVLFCFWACGVSATESGLPYNHFKEVV